jgi:hypothetical protein
MKTLHKKLIAMATLAILAVPVAFAGPPPKAPATPVASLSNIISPVSSPFTFQGTNGKVTVTYSGATPVRLAVGANTLSSQDYATVGAGVKTVFGTGAFNSDQFQVDTAATIMDKASVAHFVSSVTYNYLAVHFGQHEMFFDFGKAGVAAGTAFNIATSGPAAGLSNFRAYSDLAKIVHPATTSTVPVPGAVWLFGSGLVGLVGMRKRKAAAALTA